MAEADGRIAVEVIFCPAGQPCDRVMLALPEESTLGQALEASGVLGRHGLEAGAVRVGIWGRVQPLAAPLRDRDRVEVYRPLLVDPKEARRQRYRRQKVGG